VTDSEAIRDIVDGFMGLCSCNTPRGLDGRHTCGCQVTTSRASLKRILRLAERLEQKPALSRKQWIQARCWDKATL